MPQDELHWIAQVPRQRLDIFLLDHLPGHSRAQLQKLIREGWVRVDGAAQKPGYKFKGGESVVVRLPIVEDRSLQPQELPLDIVYEDADLAVINKAAGMVVQPGPGHESGALVNALLWRYPEVVGMSERLGIAHRLDRGTSGLMVVARQARALRSLMGQFRARSVDKGYIALLEKAPPTHTGLVDAPIMRDPKHRQRMCVQRQGKSAQTEFEVLDDAFQGDRALVALRLRTGRTHQIRVHMAFIGSPVMGDRVYGHRKQRVKMKRLFLHARELAFEHPATGERLAFTSELPVGLRSVMGKLR